MTYIIKNKKTSKYLSLDIFDNFIWDKNEKNAYRIKTDSIEEVKKFCENQALSFNDLEFIELKQYIVQETERNYYLNFLEGVPIFVSNQKEAYTFLIPSDVTLTEAKKDLINNFKLDETITFLER